MSYPPCPVFALTGLHCPGCGGVRAAHALAHGDLAAALSANALAVALLVGFATLLACRLRPAPWLGRWLLAAVVAFTLTRNVSAGAALAP